jgi:hypothetical protein
LSLFLFPPPSLLCLYPMSIPISSLFCLFPSSLHSVLPSISHLALSSVFLFHSLFFCLSPLPGLFHFVWFLRVSFYVFTVSLRLNISLFGFLLTTTHRTIHK